MSPTTSPAQSAAVDAPKEGEKSLTENSVAPQELSLPTIVEPTQNEVNPHLTPANAEVAAHVPAGPVVTTETTTTTGDLPETGKPAVPAVPSGTEAKAGDQAVANEPTEKVKAESKGFFAKLFGFKEKREKKAQTPKVDAAEHIAETATTETPAPVPKSDAAPKVAPPAIVPSPKETAPVPANDQLPAPSADVPHNHSKPTEEAATDAAPAAPATLAKDASPKALKANRRLSTRISNAFNLKTFGKQSPVAEKSKAEAETVVEETSNQAAVSSEAPQLEKPVETEPIKLEDKAEESAPAAAAPPAAPVVSTTA